MFLEEGEAEAMCSSALSSMAGWLWRLMAAPLTQHPCNPASLLWEELSALSYQEPYKWCPGF